MSIIVLLAFSQLYNLHNLYHQAKIRLFCAIKKELSKIFLFQEFLFLSFLCNCPIISEPVFSVEEHIKNRFAYTFTRTSNNITPCVNIWSNKISNCRNFFQIHLVHFSLSHSDIFLLKQQKIL